MTADDERTAVNRPASYLPASVPFPYRYAWNRMDRKGQLCRVIVRGKMNSAWIEFQDGFQAVTSRNALRKVKLPSEAPTK